MKNIRNWFISLVMVASLGGVMLTMATPQYAGAAAKGCSQGFLGFPAWYRGLVDSKCDIKSPDGSSGSLSNFIWHIVFNVVEIAIVAAAYLSGFYFIYGGFLFIISQGKPEGAAKARMAMLQALIGLIISLAAVMIIDYVMGGLKIV